MTGGPLGPVTWFSVGAERRDGRHQAPGPGVALRAVAVCWSAAGLALLLGGCGSLAPLASAPMPLAVAGTVRDANGPVAGARVQLTAYENDRCVLLARSAESPSEQDRQVLRDCARPVGEAVTDEAGRYTFANVHPGSHDVTVSWALRSGQAVPGDPIFQQGAYAVVIVRNRDGTWTVTARSAIVALPDQWDALQDFTFQPPAR